MKRIFFICLTSLLFLYSCKKEDLIANVSTAQTVPPPSSGIQSKRMDCEPFKFGVTALNNGSLSTVNMNITGNIGLSQNAASLLNTNLTLTGNYFVHSNAGNLVYSLSAIAGLLTVQSDPDTDWKLLEANQHATNLSALYASLTPHASYNNLNSNTTVTTNLTTEKPNTILNVSNFNFSGKALTLVGRVSSDDGFIINVTGTFNFTNSEIKLINVRPERVLFNFPNATNVQVKAGSKFRGTILCPTGNIDYLNPVSFEGSLVAKTINASSSITSITNPSFIQKTYCNGYQWEEESECLPTDVEVDLIAGQSINTGSISVSNDGVNLTVTYNTSNGWKMNQIHLYVGAFENIPLSGGNNPIPGQFPIAASFSPAVGSYTTTIPLSDLPDCFIVAAHAVVKKGNQTETGWGQGTQFIGSNWGMYFTYCKETCM